MISALIALAAAGSSPAASEWGLPSDVDGSYRCTAIESPLNKVEFELALDRDVEGRYVRIATAGRGRWFPKYSSNRIAKRIVFAFQDKKLALDFLPFASSVQGGHPIQIFDVSPRNSGMKRPIASGFCRPSTSFSAGKAEQAPMPVIALAPEPQSRREGIHYPLVADCLGLSDTGQTAGFSIDMSKSPREGAIRPSDKTFWHSNLIAISTAISPSKVIGDHFATFGMFSAAPSDKISGQFWIYRDEYDGEMVIQLLFGTLKPGNMRGYDIAGHCYISRGWSKAERSQ